MAYYYNQVPTTLKTGDMVFFNNNSPNAYNANFTLPKGKYKIEARGANGGDSGGASRTAQFDIYPYQKGQNVRVLGASGGRGGYVSSDYEFFANVSLNINCGAKAVSFDQNGTSEASGGGGGGAVVTINNQKYVQAGGGGGAMPGGGFVYSTYESYSNGQTGGNANTYTITSASTYAPGGNGGYHGKHEGPGGANYCFSPTNLLNTTSGSSEGASVTITTLLVNTPPTTPAPVSFPKPHAGKSIEITCAKSTDTQGDEITYVFEHKTDNNAFVTCGTSKTNSIITTVPLLGELYTARARAVDIHGAESGTSTSITQEISHNTLPTVSGKDEDFGTIQKPFSYSFSIDDEDLQDVLNVQILFDGVLIKNIENAVRKKVYSFDLEAQWLFVENTSHVLKIVVQDDKGGNAERKIKFIRETPTLHLLLKDIIETETICPTVYPFFFHSAPEGSKKMFRLCNNAFDENPTWEDVTSFDGSSNQGGIYTFNNTQKTAEKWGVGVEIKIDKPQGVFEKIVFSEALLLLYANGSETTQNATNILTNASSFLNILSPADSTVQKALETIDATLGGGVSYFSNENGMCFTMGSMQICTHTLAIDSQRENKKWTFPKKFSETPVANLTACHFEQTYANIFVREISQNELTFSNEGGMALDGVMIVAIGKV